MPFNREQTDDTDNHSLTIRLSTKHSGQKMHPATLYSEKLLVNLQKHVCCTITVICYQSHCTVLYCTVLYCNVLHCIALYCIVLYSYVYTANTIQTHHLAVSPLGTKLTCLLRHLIYYSNIHNSTYANYKTQSDPFNSASHPTF